MLAARRSSVLASSVYSYSTKLSTSSLARNTVAAATASRTISSTTTVSSNSCLTRNITASVHSPREFVSPPNYPNLLNSNKTLQKRFYAALPPHFKITMPALSPTMTQGNLLKWSKAVGDSVAPGEVLALIETDKATMDFEAPEEGVLASIFVPDGTKDVPVGKLICIIAESKNNIEAFKNVKEGSETAAPSSAEKAQPKQEEKQQEQQQEPQQSSQPQQQQQQQQQQQSGGRIFASPLARKLAEGSAIDLSTITPTGPNNRIVKADVEAAKSRAPAPTPESAPISKPSAAAAAAAAPSTSRAAQPQGTFTDIPANNIRKVIATRLTQSKQSIPHYYLTVEVRMDAVNKLREELNALGKDKYKLSVNDFIIKASALALRKVPGVNASWMDTFIRQYNTVDISVAVNSDIGLITPIVFNADQKGLSAISANVKELAARAKDGKLQPQEFQGGSFTISNLGMYGIKQFTAIINAPQACILAVGSTETRLVYDGPAGVTGPVSQQHISLGSFMSVTLSCDHRVVDGALGAQWLAAFKGYLEKPTTMLL